MRGRWLFSVSEWCEPLPGPIKAYSPELMVSEVPWRSKLGSHEFPCSKDLLPLHVWKR